MKLLLAACVALVLTGRVACATDPYQYITPTGVGSTDTAAINAALPTCATGKAIFILPGTAVLTSTINLSSPSYAGCSISGTIVGTAWDSTQGVQSTTVDCSALGVPCFTMGNSQVLHGLHIVGNGGGACIDLTSSPASGNLILDVMVDNCIIGANIAPAICCSQNNRFLNFYFLANSRPNSIGHYCGANCRFNQFSDVEDEGSAFGLQCDVGCSALQVNQYRTEDYYIGAVSTGGSDLVITGYTTNREDCARPGGSNFVMVSARCSGINSTPCFHWNYNALAATTIILRGVTCEGYNYDNLDDAAGVPPVVCNNCLIDIVYSDFGSVPAYDLASTEAALDWQRPQKTNYLQAVPLTGTTTSSAPDFQFSPNVSFPLTVASATIANPVYAHDGDRGIIELTQDATGGRTVTWGTGYTQTLNAVLNPTLNTTTFYPYTVNGTQVVLGNTWHN